MCSIAFHGFMHQCSRTVDSLANAEMLHVFDDTCTNAGTVNVPLFIDALSRAECCSSRNCGGCVDEGECTAVGSGDSSGAARQCAWAGVALRCAWRWSRCGGPRPGWRPLARFLGR